MSCHGNNATPPSPADAPGAQAIDPALAARQAAARFPGGVDPRISRAVPGWTHGPFFQAGLAGYSDAAMRLVARRLGAPCCVTEALLDRMLLGGGRGFDKADMALIHESLPAGSEDHPLVGQIIGSDPDEMAAAAVKMIEQGARHDRAYRDMAYGDGQVPDYIDTRWALCGDGSPDDTPNPQAPEPASTPEPTRPGPAGRTFDAIDVNLACPVRKIDRKNRGGHWLRQPEGAIEILRAVRAAVPPGTPCTVKLRRGYDDTAEMADNFMRIYDAAHELGYAWATVHARTVEQRYVGPSRWTFLRDLVRSRPGRVLFGSGDVWEAQDIFRMIAYTGVSGVSVARGCIGNPWLFRQARQLMAGQPVTWPTLAEQRAVLDEHFRLSVSINGERAAGRMMRKFGIKFARHHPDPDAVRSRMISVETTAQWRQILDELYTPDAEPAWPT
ncbi:MAG: hypothetical protein C0468_01325 [Planctomyces sp.]|nr:hypothetical protein [Planctomyces sp.]